MNKTRCDWVTDDPVYMKYHDEEWGVPVGLPSKSNKYTPQIAQPSTSDFSSLNVSLDMSSSEKSTSESLGSTSGSELVNLEGSRDDQKLFEFLTLESAQAGLSWITILKRREGYRRVFHSFDVQKVAMMTEQDIQKALLDEGIIRNKLKVRAAVKNAQVFIAIQREFGSFSEYIWSFVDGSPIQNCWQSTHEVPATTKVSDALSKDLKKRGMSFVGSTIIYAHCQATGMVNDHIISCFRYNEV